jgi:hypothetical protein
MFEAWRVAVSMASTTASSTASVSRVALPPAERRVSEAPGGDKLRCGACPRRRPRPPGALSLTHIHTHTLSLSRSRSLLPRGSLDGLDHCLLHQESVARCTAAREESVRGTWRRQASMRRVSSSTSRCSLSLSHTHSLSHIHTHTLSLSRSRSLLPRGSLDGLLHRGRVARCTAARGTESVISTEKP